jgi:hypothetical protein
MICDNSWRNPEFTARALPNLREDGSKIHTVFHQTECSAHVEFDASTGRGEM